MKVAIMQPYLFPYIGYYQLINAVDIFIVYDDVAFIKQGWINRNNLLLNNKKFLFFVPVKGISSFKKIFDTEIDYKMKWAKKMLMTIEQAYKKAPYFQDVFPILQSVLESQKATISELATESLLQVCKYLEIETEFKLSSVLYKDTELKGKERVIEICLHEKATHYINPIGGQELYSKEDFLMHNLHLNFIKTEQISYNQFNNEFIPSLSIIDVLMFNSLDEIKVMLNQFELI